MMKGTVLCLTLILVIVFPFNLVAQKGSRAGSRASSSRSSISSKSKAAKPVKAETVHVKASSVSPKSTVAARNANGHIRRSASARKAFMKESGYPKGRRGYVVDHIVPLECGGADLPSNMQWQTVQEAKIKDRTEKNCLR